MSIEIKITKKPVEYRKAIDLLESRVSKIQENKVNELIWILSHKNIFTAGTNFNSDEILDKSIEIVKTNRGGKITYHGKGQIVFYFVINLNKRKKDIRLFIKIIEDAIINSLKYYKIKAYRDKKNIGIWVSHQNKLKKVGAVGIKIKKWIAYHGFSLNINTNLKNFSKIIPCGIKNKDVINLNNLKKLNYSNLHKILIKEFIISLKRLDN
ncbi:MAG: lipoyl(octanoyl) transferase [Candidatus Pelagibacter sp.]|nr:lipoyl(octanoyl) transferase [Candidatus Pelagibacter sp.]